MLIPLRGGLETLELRWPFSELVAQHDDLNRSLEEAWAGLLAVLAESWPDYPVEVWVQLEHHEDDGSEGGGFEPGWWLRFSVSFAGEGADNPDVAAMVAFVCQGLGSVLRKKPQAAWGAIREGSKALWVIDDGQVYRLYAHEPTAEPSVYLLGHYAGMPAVFAAIVEAWPLRRAQVGVELAEADLAWAFG